jgi:hypothetical protein
MATEYAPRRGLDGEALLQAAEDEVDAEVIELDATRDDERPEENGKREAS